MSEIDLDAVRDAIGTVRLWAPVSATKDIHWFARDLADRTEALLARIAELEADLSDAHHEGFGVGMESADRDIDQIAAAAERRGYERAVARLRDMRSWAKWCADRIEADDGVQMIDLRQPTEAADYLDAAKESTDG